VERLLVEFIRRNPEALAGLTAPQLESVVIALVGVIWLSRKARSEGLLLPG
jgi:hypothetical protein